LQYYVLQLAAGENLRLHLEGQTGISYLFVNQASIPTSANSDFRGTAPASRQTVVFTGAPGGGTYYVLVSGEQISVPTAFNLSAEVAPFFVTAITPNQAVSGTSDRWRASPTTLSHVSLSGVGFDQQTTVEFIGPGGQARQPERLEFLDPTLLQIYLQAGVWPAGSYSVQVSKGASTVVLTNAFSVAPAGEARFEATLILPNAVDAAGGQTLYVEYANTGTRPMPAPLLKVTAATNAIICTTHLNPLLFGSIRNVAAGGGEEAGAEAEASETLCLCTCSK
jgi:hypothetical protein